MEKVRGKVFKPIFQEFRWQDKFIVAVISSANLSFFILELANIKMFNLQRKLTHFPVPLSFCKIPPI